MSRIKLLATGIVAGIVFSMLVVGVALAQTPAGVRPPPPAPLPPNARSAAQGGQGALVPPSVVDQTKEQLQGGYGAMARPRTSGQIQKAWDKIENAAPVYKTEACEDCTYKVRVREYMVSVIELPRGEIIQKIDVGDKDNFKVFERGPNRLAVQPTIHGTDTTMLVYGASGRIYPFYLRAEGFNSKNVPDVVVKIEGQVSVDPDPAVAWAEKYMADKSPAAPAMKVPEDKAADAVAGLTKPNPGTRAGDFVAEAAFDPNTLRGWGEYKLSGSDELKPETVFRDDRFTYVRFGKKWANVELPTAYVVVDGIDELVNTRVQGETFIIESTRPLITLKSGMSFLCIQYGGKET